MRASVTQGTEETAECSCIIPGGPQRELSPVMALCAVASADTAMELTYPFPAPGPGVLIGSFWTIDFLISPARGHECYACRKSIFKTVSTM